MAAALMFIRRVQSCVYLRSYLTKPSVICGTRCDYKLGLCKRDFHDGRKWPRRSLSTTQQTDHDEKERRIMVVLRKKQGELVPQLQEEDLLDYFSAYGEIEDVIWARTGARDNDPGTGKGYGFVSFVNAASVKEAVASKHHVMTGRQVFVFPASAETASAQTTSAQTTSEQMASAQMASVKTASARTAYTRTASAKSAPMASAKSAWTAFSNSMPTESVKSVPTASAKSVWAASAKPMASVKSAPTASVKSAPMSSAKSVPMASAKSAWAASAKSPPAASVKSAWTASAKSTWTKSMPTASAKSVWKTSAKSAPIAPMPSVKSAQIVSSWTASPRAEFARTGDPEVQKRKILVTRQRGWGGEITLNSVYDYFSAFGKIELVREAEDLVYITFESADSVERVMLVMNHKINDVMVLVSLAYTDKQKKQLRIEKAMDEAKVNQNPRNVKIAEKEGRKIVFMTPTRFKDSISEESLETYFSSYGAIEEIFIIESKGYGFITFKESHAVHQVLEDGDHKIDDKDIYVKMSLATRRKPQNSQGEEKRICVSNISGETSEKDIWTHFSKFGKVAEVVFANKPDTVERTDSCVVAFDSIDGRISSLANELHQVSTQRDALVVKLGEDQVTTQPYTAKLHVNNIPDEMTLEMLRSYFGGFGSIQYLGFTSYHSEGEASTMRGVSLVFNNESVLEKALNKPVHEINGLEVNVKKATRSFAGRPSDFLSLRVLMTNLPANLDELAVKDYLSGQACRVKSVRFLSPTVCIASLWNLSDVDRLVNMASEKGHVIGGNRISLRRIHWAREQDEGLELDEVPGLRN